MVRTPWLGSFLPALGEGDKSGRGVSKGYDARECRGRGPRGCAGKVLEPRMKSTRVGGRGARPGQEAVRGRWRLVTEGVLHLPCVFGETLCLGTWVEGRPSDGAAPFPDPDSSGFFFFSSALPPPPPGWLESHGLQSLGPPLNLPRASRSGLPWRGGGSGGGWRAQPAPGGERRGRGGCRAAAGAAGRER